jgi:serine/threonine protein kinase
MPSGDHPEGSSPAPGSSETRWAGGDAWESDRTQGIPDDETVRGSPQADPAGTPPAGAAAAAVTDLGEFRRALVELGLVTGEELAQLLAATATPPGGGVLGLARGLVAAGKLTAYQSAALHQRKGRGLLLGHYLILDKLGAGGMGMVFQAKHRRLGTVVALKILPPSFARDRQAVARFQREVEAAGRLNHPNIVAALDAAEDRGVHFLVMEYVAGSDLSHVVRERGPIRVGEALDCLIQAARGLEAAHAQGIVHRDIKPSNLMLDDAGTVRVLDLGLALIVDSSNPFGQAAPTRLTASGMYMGTIDYMAPEQAEDSKRADHRADIYSLGCTLFYLLTGREPFVAETVLKRLMAHQERPAPSLRAARPDVPTPLEEAYQRMMAKRPSDRPASMTEVIALLEACQTAVVESPAPQPPGTPQRSSPQLMVFDEAPRKRAGGAKPGRGESVFARRDDPADDLQIGPELSLEDLVMDVRSEIPLAAPPLPTLKRGVKPQATPLDRPVPRRSKPARGGRRRGLVLALGVLALLAMAFASFLQYVANPPETHPRTPGRTPDRTQPAGSVGETPARQVAPKTPPTIPEVRMVARTIFDGRSNQGWMLCNRRPLPLRNVQRDGLNPHGTGSYLVVYEKKLGDFVLDFDYKLSRGCNSGVFLRVGNLDDPVHTGIEVALDETTGVGYGDSGAFYSLVAPTVNAQKPAGEWNHMTIAAAGAVLAVSLNGTEVSWINLDEWSVPGKRPDGTDHIFKGIAVASLPRSGYLGFQDLRGNCWFKDIVLKTPSGSSPPS